MPTNPTVHVSLNVPVSDIIPQLRMRDLLEAFDPMDLLSLLRRADYDIIPKWIAADPRDGFAILSEVMQKARPMDMYNYGSNIATGLREQDSALHPKLLGDLLAGLVCCVPRGLRVESLVHAIQQVRVVDPVGEEAFCSALSRAVTAPCPARTTMPLCSDETE